MNEDATTSGSPPSPLDYSPQGELDDARAQRVAALISGLLRWGVRASLTLFIVGTLVGFTIGRESSEVPYGPLTQQQAARLRRVLFLIVDAGQGPQGDWGRQLDGPTGSDLVNAVTGAALYASVRSSYTAFVATMENWRAALIRWRCGLSGSALAKLRGGSGDCRDLKIYVGRVSFDQLGPERAAILGSVETRFRLPVETVDALIAGGSEALAANPAYRSFLTGK